MIPSNLKIPFNAGNVVISDKANENFDMILNGLRNGSHLYIATFGYSLSEELNKLVKEKIEYINDLRVVFGAFNLERIRYIIDFVVKNNPYIQLYYLENNHAKVISNGIQMYIGSANATSYTKNNVEIGIIMEDEKAINKIEKMLFYSQTLGCRPVFIDPIAPLIILFSLVINTAYWVMDSIETIHSSSVSLISESDFTCTDELLDGLIKEFTRIFAEVSDKLKGYYSKKMGESDVREYLLESLITNIARRLNIIEKKSLGESTDKAIGDNLEDYLHCNPQHKDEFWRSNYIFEGIDALFEEKSIMKEIDVIMDLLLYLRVKWISLIGTSTENIFYEEKIAKWLFQPDLVQPVIISLLK